jgi:hypothetical protein
VEGIKVLGEFHEMKRVFSCLLYFKLHRYFRKVNEVSITTTSFRSHSHSHRHSHSFYPIPLLLPRITLKSGDLWAMRSGTFSVLSTINLKCARTPEKPPGENSAFLGLHFLVSTCHYGTRSRLLSRANFNRCSTRRCSAFFMSDRATPR